MSKADKKRAKHFSDARHLDTCANPRCNTMDNRANMVKASTIAFNGLPPNPKKRGWWCRRCVFNLPVHEQDTLF